MSDEGCEQSGQQDSGEVEITETTSPVSVMWIWSISIPSERARIAASFIIPFLDCIPIQKRSLHKRKSLMACQVPHRQAHLSPKVAMSQMNLCGPPVMVR